MIKIKDSTGNRDYLIADLCEGTVDIIVMDDGILRMICLNIAGAKALACELLILADRLSEEGEQL